MLFFSLISFSLMLSLSIFSAVDHRFLLITKYLYLLLVSHLSRWRSPCPFFPTTVSYSTFPSSWNLICTWPHVLFVLFFYIEYLFFVVSRYARSFWWLFEQGNQWSFSSTLLAGILRYPWRKLTHIYVWLVWVLLAQLRTLDLVCISMRFFCSRKAVLITLESPFRNQLCWIHQSS